jgi:hypothetical protein
LLLQLATEVTSVLALLGPVLLVLATVVDNVVVAHDVPGMTARPENARTQTTHIFKPLVLLILPPFWLEPRRQVIPWLIDVAYGRIVADNQDFSA